MTSAQVVALALLAVAGSVETVRAQVPGPGKSATTGAEPWALPAELLLRQPNTPSYEGAIHFKELRSRIEKEGMATKDGAEMRLSRQELCRRVAAYAEAEIKLVRYAEMKMNQFGISDRVVNEMKAAHIRTADTQARMCSASNPGYRWDPPLRPKDYKLLPRFSGR